MTKNKILLFVITILCSVGIVYKLQPVTVAPPSLSNNLTRTISESILKRDRAKFEKYFSKETLQDRTWPSINDYSISTKELINKDNGRYYFRLINNSIANLTSCLKKNFCGMERRNENDAYFDESKTPGHILLKRYLTIMIYSLNLYPDLQHKIDWNLIRELTENINENVQVLALELLNNFNALNNGNYNLFKIVDNYRGNAKAEALTELSIKTSSDGHLLLVNSLENTFSSDDPNTVISVLEKLDRMNLSQEESEKISKYLCHYKEDGPDNPNWKMIKYDMKNLSIDLKKVCN